MQRLSLSRCVSCLTNRLTSDAVMLTRIASAMLNLLNHRPQGGGPSLLLQQIGKSHSPNRAAQNKKENLREVEKKKKEKKQQRYRDTVEQQMCVGVARTGMGASQRPFIA